MKNIQNLILLMFSVILCQCQKKELYRDSVTQIYSSKDKKDNDSIILNISKGIFPTEIDYIKVYKYDSKNDCEQSKAVSIVYNNHLSSCFNYLKTFKNKDVKDFIIIIKDPKTYGAEDIACFDTDYALLLYNKKNEVVAYINISESCNKLISNPEIKERHFYSQDGLRKVGFSKKGKEKIKQILGI